MRKSVILLLVVTILLQPLVLNNVYSNASPSMTPKVDWESILAYKDLLDSYDYIFAEPTSVQSLTEKNDDLTDEEKELIDELRELIRKLIIAIMEGDQGEINKIIDLLKKWIDRAKDFKKLVEFVLLVKQMIDDDFDNPLLMLDYIIALLELIKKFVPIPKLIDWYIKILEKIRELLEKIQSAQEIREICIIDIDLGLELIDLTNKLEQLKNLLEIARENGYSDEYIQSLLQQIAKIQKRIQEILKKIKKILEEG